MPPPPTQRRITPKKGCACGKSGMIQQTIIDNRLRMLQLRMRGLR